MHSACQLTVMYYNVFRLNCALQKFPICHSGHTARSNFILKNTLVTKVLKYFKVILNKQIHFSAL